MELCDEGLFQNALKRSVSKWQYEDASSFKCAIGYAFGIAKAHAFGDGDKRPTFVIGIAFLRLNGQHFVTASAVGLEFTEGLASNQLCKENFKKRLSKGSTKIT